MVDNRRTAPPERPTIKVWSSGMIALSKGVIESFIGEETTHVGMSTDHEHCAIVLDPSKDDYILQTRGDFHGKLVTGTATIKELGCRRPSKSVEVPFDVADSRVRVRCEELLE